MTTVPNTFLFAETHEWADAKPDGLVWVGISDHAQAALGDVVFLEPPKLNSSVQQGLACAVIESVKAASDIHAPVSGTVVEINSELLDAPELINEHPYSAWIFKIQPNNAEALSSDLQRLSQFIDYQSSLN